MERRKYPKNIKRFTWLYRKDVEHLPSNLIDFSLDQHLNCLWIIIRETNFSCWQWRSLKTFTVIKPDCEEKKIPVELTDRFVLLHLKAQIISSTDRLFFFLFLYAFKNCKEKLKMKLLELQRWKKVNIKSSNHKL